MQSYYKLLDVRIGSSDKEILQAYHRKAKQFHPDTGGREASADSFRAVKEAYHALQSSEDRQRFETQIRASHQIARFHALAKKKELEETLKLKESTQTLIERKKSQKIVNFPIKQKQTTLRRVFAELLESISSILSTIREGHHAARARREDEYHRIVTRALNKIPESEIGLRQAS